MSTCSKKSFFNTLAQLEADRNGQFTKYKKGARWAKIWLITFLPNWNSMLGLNRIHLGTKVGRERLTTHSSDSNLLKHTTIWYNYFGT